MPYRALVFDAYGTLYDVQSVHGAVAEIEPNKATLVTQLWRQKQLEYTWLRGLMGAYEDFWSVTRAALDFALDAAEVTASPTIRERLMAKYLNLDLYPDARPALAALKDRKLAILSNGGPTMLEALVKNSGVADLFDDVISVDRVKSYKPDPKCYALATSALGVTKGEILFVSSNGFDIAGAKNFGLATAWINRGGGSSFFGLQRGRAERLGQNADFRIPTLTDLPLIP